jgi:hypothetical protein
MRFIRSAVAVMVILPRRAVLWRYQRNALHRWWQAVLPADIGMTL